MFSTSSTLLKPLIPVEDWEWGRTGPRSGGMEDGASDGEALHQSLRPRLPRRWRAGPPEVTGRREFEGENP